MPVVIPANDQCKTKANMRSVKPLVICPSGTEVAMIEAAITEVRALILSLGATAIPGEPALQ